MPHIEKTSGFSLVELMVVISLVAVFSAVAMPSFNFFIRSNKVQSTGTELYNLFEYARAEAITRAESVEISQTGSSWTLKTASSSGINNTIKELQISDPNITITASSKNIKYLTNGTTSSILNIIICSNNDATRGQKLTIERTGKIKLSKQGRDENDRVLNRCS